MLCVGQERLEEEPLGAQWEEGGMKTHIWRSETIATRPWGEGEGQWGRGDGTAG